MTRRLVVKLLARLSASPLRATDSTRLALEWELLQLLEQIELAELIRAHVPSMQIAPPSVARE